MDKYLVIDADCGSRNLQDLLNGLASSGYRIVQTIQGYGTGNSSNDMWTVTPLLILELPGDLKLPTAPSPDDFISLTPEGAEAIQHAKQPF